MNHIENYKLSHNDNIIIVRQTSQCNPIHRKADCSFCQLVMLAVTDKLHG